MSAILWKLSEIFPKGQRLGERCAKAYNSLVEGFYQNHRELADECNLHLAPSQESLVAEW